MSETKTIVVRAEQYRCPHKILGMPYWWHRAYDLDIVGYGCTMAPSKRKITEWARDYLVCSHGEEAKEWELIIEWK